MCVTLSTQNRSLFIGVIRIGVIESESRHTPPIQPPPDATALSRGRCPVIVMKMLKYTLESPEIDKVYC